MMRGIISTLSNPKGSIYIPVAAPIVLRKLRTAEEPELGMIAAGHRCYERISVMADDRPDRRIRDICRPAGVHAPQGPCRQVVLTPDDARLASPNDKTAPDSSGALVISRGPNGPASNVRKSVTAGMAARRRRHIVFACGCDHFNALAGRILRRSALVLHAFGRHHHGLRHHHSAVLRRRAMRDDAARRHHHGFLDGTVLRRHDLSLIAGDARRGRRRVAAMASCGRCCRKGHRRDGRSNQCCINA